MPLPLIAAGLVITVGASCAAWFFNELTSEEKRTQQRERQKQNDLRQEYAHDSATLEKQHRERLRALAEKQLYASLKIIEQCSLKENDIAEGIAELYRVFKQEMVADSTSPSRKAVLRREYCRIEDADVRLQEYRRYLVAEREILEALFRHESYVDLMDRELPQALLPIEWLYPGKLVLVGMHEIGVKLPGFEHKLVFGKNRVEQQALAIGNGAEFPVLVTGQSKTDSSVFFGCVARGKLYCDHIRVGTPATMEVDRAGKSVRCQMFGDLVRADLPRNNMLHPELTYLPGQKVLVYPELYDLCLQRNPFADKTQPIQVSEYPPAEFGTQGRRELYLEVTESQLSLVSDERFFSNDTCWTLLDHDPESRRVLLGKSNVRVECHADPALGVLIVENVEQCTTPQMGFDISFQLVLISEQINARELVAWPEGMAEFMRLALQVVMGKEHAQAREAQAEFMRRWQRVVDYQIAQENIADVKFKARISHQEGNSRQQLVIPSDQLAKTSVLDIYERVYSDGKNSIKFPEKCFRLDRWDSTRGTYLPAMSELARKRANYSSEDQGIVITADLFPALDDGTDKKYRFTVSVPSAPLDRQRSALDDFFNDRMVSPDIKDILLAPAAYLSPTEGDKKSNLHFFGKLNESQKVAVSLALSPAHLSLIQGPPGTGKTTVIVELIRQILEGNPRARVLVVSQQNAAVDNALSRYSRELRSIGSPDVGIVRIGKPEKVDAELAHLQLDSILQLFKDGLRVTGERVRQNGSEQDSTLAGQWLGYLAAVDNSSYGPHHEELFVTLLADKQLVGATCVGLASRRAGIDSLQFDFAIIDEAGRSTVPELLIPMMRARKVVLIGDHYQLPPSIAPLLREDAAKEEMDFLRETFLETSFFELLYDGLPDNCKTILNEQFRMPPAIGDLVADIFYSRNGRRVIHNGECVHDRAGDILEESLYWVNVDGQHTTPPNSTSLENKKEAAAIARFLKWLSEAMPHEKVEVAVITPYSAQTRCIRNFLSANEKENGMAIRIGSLLVKVATVDSFQGSEADVVCYSPVRTSGPLQFILDRKRLNVACSRAKKHLLFFGHQAFLSAWKPNKGEQNLFAEIARRASEKTVCTRGGVTWI